MRSKGFCSAKPLQSVSCATSAQLVTSPIAALGSPNSTARQSLSDQTPRQARKSYITVHVSLSHRGSVSSRDPILAVNPASIGPLRNITPQRSPATRSVGSEAFPGYRGTTRQAPRVLFRSCRVVVARQVHSRTRHQSGQTGQKIQRLEDHVRGAVAVRRLQSVAN